MYFQGQCHFCAQSLSAEDCTGLFKKNLLVVKMNVIGHHKNIYAFNNA